MEREKIIFIGLNLILGLVVVAIALSGNQSKTGNKGLLEEPSLCEKNCSQPYNMEHGTEWMKKKDPEKPFTTYYRSNISGWADSMGIPPFKVRTNSKGLREERFKTRKPDNTTRILVIGDSFTFGLGVNRSERFTDLVESRLRDTTSGTRLQFINAGISGTGMEDYYKFLKYRGVKYEPDIVVIAFIGSDWYSAEDIREDVEEAKKRARKKYGSNLTDLSQKKRFEKVREELYAIHNQYIERTPIENTSFGYLYDIHNLSRQENIKPVYYVIGKVGRDKTKKFVKSWNGKHNETVFYAPSSFRDDLSPEVRASKWDRHPNPRGHRLIAERLYPILQQKLREKN